MEITTGSGPSAALDRHRTLREAGVPTLSVLSGPPGLASREARVWAVGIGRPIVEVDDARAVAIVDAWADRMAAGGALRRSVVAGLARRLGDVADLDARGYFVVRTLAGDVVRRLEDVLDLILETVAACRADRLATNRDACS